MPFLFYPSGYLHKLKDSSFSPAQLPSVLLSTPGAPKWQSVFFSESSWERHPPVPPPKEPHAENPSPSTPDALTPRPKGSLTYLGLQGVSCIYIYIYIYIYIVALGPKSIPSRYMDPPRVPESSFRGPQSIPQLRILGRSMIPGGCSPFYCYSE